jgi:hypothetical protein
VGVFDDEAADIFLADETDVAVLLLATSRTSELCFEVATLDPARHRMGVNPQWRKTIGGIEVGIVLELHSSQLEVNSGDGARVAGGLELQPNPLVAHPGIAFQDVQLRLAPRLFLGTGKAQFAPVSSEPSAGYPTSWPRRARPDVSSPRDG